MAAIAVKHLSKAYGKTHAVADVSLEVRDGEFAVLLGSSGSGKTTLLRCLAGLEKPDSGLISIGGRDMSGVPPRDREISMVFQNYALFPLMTVRQNIAFPLAVRNTPKDQAAKRVSDLASRLGISGILDKSPRNLSGGEQQRVAIARALVRETSAILMDEPLSNLDAPLRAQLRMELKSLQRDFGRTMVYVTHDQVEAMTLADRIGVMNADRLLQYDAPLNVYSHPGSSFVAGFVGNPPASLLRLKVGGGNPPVLAGGGIVLTPPDQMRRTLEGRSGKDVTLAVRAEGIRLGGDEGGSVAGRILLVERLGPNTIVDVQAGDFVLRSLAPGSFEARTGDDVKVSIDYGSASLFDGESDGRLG